MGRAALPCSRAAGVGPAALRFRSRWRSLPWLLAWGACCGFGRTPFRERSTFAARPRQSVVRGESVVGGRSSASVATLRRGSRVADSRREGTTGKKALVVVLP